MNRCLQIEYRYHDTDIIEVAIATWNGGFGGSTRLYVSHGELQNMADLLDGFPISVKDCREVTLGAFGPEFAGGALELHLSCCDAAGHSCLLVAVEAIMKPGIRRPSGHNSPPRLNLHHSTISFNSCERWMNR